MGEGCSASVWGDGVHPKRFFKITILQYQTLLMYKEKSDKMFISRDLQVAEKCPADNQRIKMSESQGWDLYAAHT